MMCFKKLLIITFALFIFMGCELTNETWDDTNGSANENGSYESFIKVAFLGYNTDEELVFYDWTYADKYGLGAGETSTVDFLISPHLNTKIKSVRVIGYSD